MADKVDTLQELADHIKSRGISRAAIMDIFDSVYAKGYKRGVSDQKKINSRLKFKYNVLLEWLEGEHNDFYLFTRRPEYKDIFDKLSKIFDDYISSNRLSVNTDGGKKYKVLDDNNKLVCISYKEYLQESLSNIVQDFMDHEEIRRNKSNSTGKEGMSDIFNQTNEDE